MTDSDTLAAVERWFRSRGIPNFIDDFSASRDVFTRALDGPFLAVTMGLFVVVGIVFVVARIPLDVGALARFDSWSDVAALFLTAFSGFYFTVYVLTDATYRKEFLDEVLVELRQAFAVRAVYLASRPVPSA